MSASAHVVVMGVAGCGKSAVGQRLAALLGVPMIEGDEFHPPANVQKMQQGIALTDDDRAGWLASLGERLAGQGGGAVMSCSALKRDYREALRQAVPGLAFVYLHIAPEESLRRVAARPGHFYPPSLVASQFEALQDPTAEAHVLRLDATTPMELLAAQAAAWLLAQPAAGP